MTLNKPHISGIVGVLLMICLIIPLTNNALLPPSCMERQWKFFYLSWMIFIPALSLGLICWKKELKERLPLFLTYGFLLAGAYEVVEGISQLSGASLSAHRLFAVTGTFYNPAPYSGYLSLVFPLCFFFLLKYKSAPLYGRILLWIATAALLLMILIGMSRSAWVAAIASACYVWLSYSNPLPRLAASFRANMKRNALLAITLFALLILFAIYLFFLKENSAIGRILIWKISLSAIMQAPLTGYGYQSFESIYGAAQESYFSTLPHRSGEAWVADTPEFAFNEYLQLAMEWGIPALCLAVSGLACSLWAWHRDKQYGLAGSIIAIAVFAFTSYPLRIPGLLSATLLLMVSGWAIALPLAKKRLVYTVAFTACIACHYCFRAYKIAEGRENTLYAWYDGHKAYMKGDYTEAIQKYTPLYQDMRWNANYLLELGNCLQQSERYYESIHVLLMAETLSAHVTILELIGTGYQNIGCMEKAETYFIRSSRRVPSRITPYYLLARLYAHPANNQSQRAMRMAGEVISRKPKVDTKVSRDIKKEAQKIIELLKQRNKQNESDKESNE